MNYALIFAGGVGSRMNSKARPKQFLEIHGKPIIVQTIEHFENHAQIDAIAVVCRNEWIQYMKNLVKKNRFEKVKWIVPGGDSALNSQFNGLKAIQSAAHNGDDAIVLIHDGVRPLIDEDTISKCIQSVSEYGSAVTITRATETVVVVDDNHKIIDTINRTECCLARAPQCFYLNEIVAVHEQSIFEERRDFIDSATMMRYYGKDIYVVEGPNENIKVTNPADFYICKALLDAKESSQIFGI